MVTQTESGYAEHRWEPIEDHVQGRCWRRSLAQVGRKREVARLQVCYRCCYDRFSVEVHDRRSQGG